MSTGTTETTEKIDRKYMIFWAISMFLLIVVSVMEKPPVPKVDFNGLDKIEHLIAYFIVSAFAFKAFLEPKTRNAICVFMIGVGIMLEILHKYIPGRFFEYADMGANVAGVVIAFWFIRKFGKSSITSEE